MVHYKVNGAAKKYIKFFSPFENEKNPGKKITKEVRSFNHREKKMWDLKREEKKDDNLKF